MKIEVLLDMILIFPKSRNEAKNSTEIQLAYFKEEKPENKTDRGSRNKFISDQIKEMEDLELLEVIPGGANGIRNRRYDQYFLGESSVMKHFMKSEVALNLLFSKQVMPSILGDDNEFKFKNVYEAALATRMGTDELALSNKIRLIPDGIQRKEASIGKSILPVFVSAIKKNNSVLLSYRHRNSRHIEDEISEEKYRTVLGLVVKEGAIYAVTCRGLQDTPTHIPLHRVLIAIESGHKGQPRREFILDDYIKQQNQLSHVISEYPEPIEMVLKVHPDAMWHFDERAIISEYGEAVVITPNNDSEWRTIKLKLAFTVQLPPFIWSHAGWVEVVSPPELRTYVGERIRAAATLYKDIDPKFDLKGQPGLSQS